MPEPSHVPLKPGDREVLRARFDGAAVEICDENPGAIFMTADLAAYTDLFRLPKERPRQFLDVGMAEQNLMCIAGGLAKTGFLPIATTFACYATRRAFDQMVMSMGTGPSRGIVIGFASGISSAARIHRQATDDLAMMRAVPGVCIIDPARRPGGVCRSVACRHPVSRARLYARIARGRLDDVREGGQVRDRQGGRVARRRRHRDHFHRLWHAVGGRGLRRAAGAGNGSFDPPRADAETRPDAGHHRILPAPQDRPRDREPQHHRRPGLARGGGDRHRWRADAAAPHRHSGPLGRERRHALHPWRTRVERRATGRPDRGSRNCARTAPANSTTATSCRTGAIPWSPMRRCSSTACNC